jgi:hypothetical protein
MKCLSGIVFSLVRFRAAGVEAVFLDFLVQRLSSDPEDFGGTRLVPSLRGEGLADENFLGLGERCADRHSHFAFTVDRSQARRKIVDPDQGPDDMTTALSMQLRSSRTFPGQG